MSQAVAGKIDLTLLRPGTTEAEIRQLCADAIKYGCVAVCVNPCWILLCVRLLAGTGVRVCAVIGFPLGATLSMAKAYEARLAVDDGADELDMVMNLDWLKTGNNKLVVADIQGVVVAAQGYPVKVIIETCLLTPEEIKVAAQLVVEAGAQFVKTSTGFSTGGATAEVVQLLREVVGPDFGVKASGGIRTLKEAMAMVAAGANRLGIGHAAGVKIAEEEKAGQEAES